MPVRSKRSTPESYLLELLKAHGAPRVLSHVTLPTRRLEADAVVDLRGADISRTIFEPLRELVGDMLLCVEHESRGFDQKKLSRMISKATIMRSGRRSTRNGWPPVPFNAKVGLLVLTERVPPATARLLRNFDQVRTGVYVLDSGFLRIVVLDTRSIPPTPRWAPLLLTIRDQPAYRKLKLAEHLRDLGEDASSFYRAFLDTILVLEESMNTHQTAESPYERVLRLGREQGIERGRLDALLTIAVDFGASKAQVDAWMELPVDEAIAVVHEWIRRLRQE